MAFPQRIVLTGFMGSGKTTVGRLLGRELGYMFCDLDHEIERTSGLTVPAIFAEKGESHFRDLELQTLRDLLRHRKIVIALGGGAIETAALRELLSATQDTATIYLQAEFDVLYARCQVQAMNPKATARPNLADPEAARQRHENRAPHYQAAATHTVAVDERNARETLAVLLEQFA